MNVIPPPTTPRLRPPFRLITATNPAGVRHAPVDQYRVLRSGEALCGSVGILAPDTDEVRSLRPCARCVSEALKLKD